ncbi:hypothetical protein WN51_07535 [Melipona quadrifasciata]|uniref:Uncharacterized protein n=1 Tax=Melipona quadrifasciata TaxID=166423 RepID=A0A0N0U756_9HYME|nr:hypothetical protein WN51_07535 [Melipona quadrifasciata]
MEESNRSDHCTRAFEAHRPGNSKNPVQIMRSGKESRLIERCSRNARDIPRTV